MRGLAGLVAIAILAAGCGGGAQRTFRNPVYDADFPDPFVLKAGDTYYAYGTNARGEQVQTLTSKDLVTWTRGPDALPTVGRWGYPGRTWAPEVLARGDGTYVLYYTAVLCVGAATATRPLGPFVDRAPQPLVCQRANGGSIDASPFRDDDGKLYLVWKNDGNSVGQPTLIWAQRLSADGLHLVGRRVAIERNDAVWEAGVVEAPTLWKQRGRYYLFYSGNAYDTDQYAVGYATCAGPLGPCRDAPENPILKSGCGADGPGHNALLRVGSTTWIVYHAWPRGKVGTKRVLRIDPLRWKGGKPVVKGPTCAAEPAP